MCISVRCLAENIAEGEHFLPPYQGFLSNRRAKYGTTAHGGSLICVKKEITSENVKKSLKDDDSVTACLISSCKQKYFLFAVINRPQTVLKLKRKLI